MVATAEKPKGLEINTSMIWGVSPPAWGILKFECPQFVPPSTSYDALNWNKTGIGIVTILAMQCVYGRPDREAKCTAPQCTHNPTCFDMCLLSTAAAQVILIKTPSSSWKSNLQRRVFVVGAFFWILGELRLDPTTVLAYICLK